MTAPSHPSRLNLAALALLAANIALACGPWLVRLAERDGGVGPVTSGFWRLALALPVLAFAAMREAGPPAGARKAVVGAAMLSGLFFAADLGLWHIGILHTRLANATLLGNVTAILFPLYGFVAARRAPSRRQAFALLLAAAGAGLLFGRSYELSARNLAGDLICMGAGLAYTAYLIAADRARTALGPIRTLTCAVAVGTPVLLAAALRLEDTIWPRDWTALVLMSIGSQLVGQGLILYAVTRVPPLLVGVMLLTQPIVAATIGWIAYGEALTPVDGIGAIAIAAAVLLVRGTGPRLPAAEKAVNLGT
jgi:drug/metabolite transporter (DMT)-like permease